MIHFYDPNHINSKKTSSSIGYSVLHVGDFRADQSLIHNHILSQKLIQYQGLDSLYLDTTYCNPKYTFPPQEECLLSLSNTVKMELLRRPSTLFAISAYTIGKIPFYDFFYQFSLYVPPKRLSLLHFFFSLLSLNIYIFFFFFHILKGKEKAVVAIALATGGKVLVTENRKRILRLCGYWNNIDDLVLNDDFNNSDDNVNKSGGKGDMTSNKISKSIFTTNENDPEIAVVLAKSTNHEGMKSLLLALPQIQREKFDTVIS